MTEMVNYLYTLIEYNVILKRKEGVKNTNALKI